MPYEPDASLLLARFAECASERLVAQGWSPVREETPDSTLIFLGEFECPVGEEFVATVELILESGPVVRGAMLFPTGLVKQRLLRAVVGGEVGLCHRPTGELHSWLGARCETNIALDLEEMFADRGLKLPVITDERSATEAAQILAAFVTHEGMAFAREHADVDRMLQFFASGAQTARTPEFDGLFVPALLAASDRPAAARDALVTYRDRFAFDAEELAEFDDFAERLRNWLA